MSKKHKNSNWEGSLMTNFNVNSKSLSLLWKDTTTGEYRGLEKYTFVQLKGIYTWNFQKNF